MLLHSAVLTALWGLLVAGLPPIPNPEAGKTLPRRQASRFLNERSAKFSINGTNFPYVPFDIGESYGGNLPVSSNQTDSQQLYFWFFPSDNPAAHDEITVWLNGGPGCSSLIGLLQENGKFLWQPGQIGPVLNDWSWTKLTNMVWIEQPIGTGFATGAVTAVDTLQSSQQFLGFWKNFIDTFNMTGFKVYFAGESYAGQFIPYLASAMLDANETDPGYFNIRGTLLIDPAISPDALLVELPMLNFTESHQEVLRFNESFRAYARDIHANQFNYTGFFEKYFKFPTDGPMPTPPNVEEGNSPFRGIMSDAAGLINPCLNIYNILDHCPYLYDPLSLTGTSDGGLGVFFDNAEVKAAMHAPNIPWHTCNGPVYVNGPDQAPRPSFSILPRVFERLPLNIVANGALDFLIPSVGTLFSLQNITWAGKTGFENPPTRKFILPDQILPGGVTSQQVLGPVGETGNWVYERGVIFVNVEGAGHMLPQHNPSAGFRLLEVLLGRVSVEAGMGGGAAWSV